MGGEPARPGLRRSEESTGRERALRWRAPAVDQLPEAAPRMGQRFCGDFTKQTQWQTFVHEHKTVSEGKAAAFSTML